MVNIVTFHPVSIPPFYFNNLAFAYIPLETGMAIRLDYRDSKRASWNYHRCAVPIGYSANQILRLVYSENYRGVNEGLYVVA